MTASRTWAIVAIALACAGAAPSAVAQAYPSKPIRLIVATAPGGPSDTLARTLAQRLQEKRGWAAVVENRPGANSIIGAEAVAKAAPDGYTLLVTTGTAITINQHLFKNLPYNPATDFVPVGKLGMSYFVMYAKNELPFNNARDFVAYAKANPAKLAIGINGTATPPHFAVKNLEFAAGTTFNIIPYKGAAPAFNDLVGGQVDLVLESPSLGLSHVKSGRVKAVAATGPKPFPALPDVRPLADIFPGFEGLSWFGVMAPAGTPRDIVVRLNREIQDYVADPATQEKIAALNFSLDSGPPEQMAEYIRTETAKWGELIRKTGITVEQ
jgi:tripartite-type tricarboxylate transporter receptor subunit TctC